MKNLMRSSFLVALACLGLLFVAGCNNGPTDPPKPVNDGKSGPAPTTTSDAMSNPNVPESAKAQMKHMPGAPGGGGR